MPTTSFQLPSGSLSIIASLHIKSFGHKHIFIFHVNMKKTSVHSRFTYLFAWEIIGGQQASNKTDVHFKDGDFGILKE